MLLHKPARAEERPLTLADMPAPTPGEDDLFLRINGCGICRTDLHVVEGE